MTITQQIATIALCVLGTVTTRCLPFLIFTAKKPVPKYIKYLGNALPSAIFGMLVIYCLKDVSVFAYSYGLPELFSILLTIFLHLWQRKMLLSIAGGTLCHMFLLQVVFTG